MDTERLAGLAHPSFEVLEPRVLLDAELIAVNVIRCEDFAHGQPGDHHYEYIVEFIANSRGVAQVTTPWGETAKSSDFLPPGWDGRDYDDVKGRIEFEAYADTNQDMHFTFDWQGLSADEWAALGTTPTSLKAVSGKDVWTGTTDFSEAPLPTQQPVILSPSDGQTGVSVTPTIQWGAWNAPLPGGQIWLGVDGPADQVLWEELNAGATSYDIITPALMDGAPYDIELNFVNTAGFDVNGVQVNPMSGVQADSDFVTVGRMPYIVDLSRFYYSDTMGRLIDYDFSAGTADPDGSITIPDAAVTGRPAAEALTDYAWEVIQDEYPVTQVLDTQAGVATFSSWDGGAALGATGPTAAAASTYRIEASFSRFDIVKTDLLYYEVSVRTGAWEDGVDPNVCADWFSPQGSDQWALALYTGFHNRLTGSEWHSTPVILRNLDPAATTVDLRVESVGGTVMKGAYRLNGGAWVSLGQHSVTGGRTEGFPTRFPCVWMDVAGAEEVPDLVGSIGEIVGPDTVVPGDKLKVPVTVTNAGDGPARGSIAIDLYAATHDASQPITQDDWLVGRLTKQAINLAPNASRKFTVPVTGPTAPPGDYYLLAVIDAQDAILELNEGNNVAATDGPGHVVWQFGLVGERKNVKLNVQDADGTLVKFSLTGAGTGTVDPSGPVWTLDLANTAAASTATIAATKSKTPGDDGEADLAGITATGPLGSLAAPKVNLTGSICVDGALGSLTLGDFSAGTLSVGAKLQTVPPTAGVKMRFDRVADAQVDSRLPILSLTATEWINTQGPAQTIQAPRIGTLTITGDLKRHIAGNLGANVTVTETAKTAITTLKVAGLLDRATILSAGSMGTLTLGGTQGSMILAGFTEPIASLPTQHTDFDNPAACIANLKISGLRDSTCPFAASSIVSPKLGTVVVRDVDGTGTDLFGVVADHLAGLTSYTRYAGKTVAKKLSNLKQAGVFDSVAPLYSLSLV